MVNDDDPPWPLERSCEDKMKEIGLLEEAERFEEYFGVEDTVGEFTHDAWLCSDATEDWMLLMIKMEVALNWVRQQTNGELDFELMVLGDIANNIGWATTHKWDTEDNELVSSRPGDLTHDSIREWREEYERKND